jgi:hypothetical protein
VSDQDHRHGRQPERGPVAELARLFLVQLAAVIGIATAIAVVVAFVGPDGDDDVTTASPGGSPTASATPATPGPSTTKKSPSPSAPAPSTSSDTGTTSPASPTVGAPAPVPVDVLNQSAPNGTAEQVAARLEDAGWEIGRVDDFHGNVSTTTVYWLDPEQKRQARQVSRFLGGARVQEGFDTLVDGRVSVVLVD